MRQIKLMLTVGIKSKVSAVLLLLCNIVMMLTDESHDDTKLNGTLEWKLWQQVIKLSETFLTVPSMDHNLLVNISRNEKLAQAHLDSYPANIIDSKLDF